MDERTLFRIALGLDDPWEVKEIKFDAEKQQLDIYIDFPKGSKFLVMFKSLGVTAQYLGAMIMDSRLRGNDEIGQPPVIPAEAGIQ